MIFRIISFWTVEIFYTYHIIRHIPLKEERSLYRIQNPGSKWKNKMDSGKNAHWEFFKYIFTPQLQSHVSVSADDRTWSCTKSLKCEDKWWEYSPLWCSWTLSKAQIHLLIQNKWLIDVVFPLLHVLYTHLVEAHVWGQWIRSISLSGSVTINASLNEVKCTLHHAAASVGRASAQMSLGKAIAQKTNKRIWFMQEFGNPGFSLSSMRPLKGFFRHFKGAQVVFFRSLICLLI